MEEEECWRYRIGRGYGRFSGSLHSGWERGYLRGAGRRYKSGARVASYSSSFLSPIK